MTRRAALPGIVALALAIGLLPGVIPNISTESFGSDSVSVNGQDARNNNYLLDGVEGFGMTCSTMNPLPVGK